MKTNQTAIGMLRQWLNEDRIDDPKKMVTNEQIEMWLALDPLKEEEGECRIKSCTGDSECLEHCPCDCHQEKETEKYPCCDHTNVQYPYHMECTCKCHWKNGVGMKTPKKLPSHEIEKIHSRMFYSQDKNDERGECELWRDSILEYLDETAKQ